MTIELALARLTGPWQRFGTITVERAGTGPPATPT